jgi:hypothetical protein
MLIIGADYHPSFQQIAFVDTETGELKEQRLAHREGAEEFYRALAARGQQVRVGMEASGHARWFERLLAELKFELWVGDAAEIRRKRGRKQKTDRQDAQHILGLLLKDDFPPIWVPSWENRDLRQLLWHRHRMVQARTRIMNQLQAVALNEGLLCKKKLWRERGRQQLEAFRLAPWASRRRHDLLELLDRLNPTIGELSQAIEQGGEVWRSLAVDDAPGRRCVDRTGVRADHRGCEAFSVWQAGGELSGTSAARRFQWESAATGTHYQAREFDAALSAGGSGSSHGTQPARMAPQVRALDDAAWPQDCQGRDGAETSDSAVLDDAPGVGLSAVDQIRFARRTARNRRWCSVEHRVIDWGSCSSLLEEEFEVVIMIRQLQIEEMHGSD